jgi:hypothetical protein
MDTDTDATGRSRVAQPVFAIFTLRVGALLLGFVIVFVIMTSTMDTDMFMNIFIDMLMNTSMDMNVLVHRMVLARE